MTSLKGALSAAASAAFEAMGLEARWGEVRRSDKPELADFPVQWCNGRGKGCQEGTHATSPGTLRRP